MYIREQRQRNPVADEVLALTAVVRPILTGTLYALKQEIVAGREDMRRQAIDASSPLQSGRWRLRYLF